MNTFAAFDRTPYDDEERQHDHADLSFLDTTPASFQIAPDVPDMATLRAAAHDIMEQSAIAKRRDEAALSYVELSTDDLREILGVGDWVKYHRHSFGSFEGEVKALCAETDRALVRFDDGFGVRQYWLALDLLQLLLSKSAREVESEGG